MEQSNNKSLHNSLPPIKVLFQESWNRFVASIGGLFIMGMMTFALTALIGMVVAIIIGIVLALSGVFASSASGGGAAVLRMLPGILVSGLLGTVGLVSLIVLSTAGSIAQIMIVVKSPEKLGTIDTLKKSLPFVVPLMLTGMLTSFILMGTFFLFFFPALIFSFFFMFTNLVIVVDGKKYREALRHSSLVVGEHFGEILIRILAMGIVYLFVLVFIPEVLRRIAPGTAAILSLYMVLINVLFSWFGLSYFVTLYHHAKSAVGPSKKGSLMPAVVVSLIGWALVVVSIVLVVAFVPWKEIQKSMKESTKKSYSLLDTKKSTGNVQADLLYEQSQALFKQIQAVDGTDSYIRTTVTELNDRNIEVLQSALKLSPDNAKLWSSLGAAYTWISTDGSLEDALAASQKAEELEPDNVAYINQVGDVYLQLKEFDKAVIQFKKTLRLMSNSGYGHQGLGHAYAGLKIYDQAKVEYKEAIRIFTAANKDGSFDTTILETQKALAGVDAMSK